MTCNLITNFGKVVCARSWYRSPPRELSHGSWRPTILTYQLIKNLQLRGLMRVRMRCWWILTSFKRGQDAVLSQVVGVDSSAIDWWHSRSHAVSTRPKWTFIHLVANSPGLRQLVSWIWIPIFMRYSHNDTLQSKRHFHSTALRCMPFNNCAALSVPLWQIQGISP